jgi:Ca-activated chloride channel family protein
MSFVYWSYFPLVLVFAIVGFFLLKRYEKKYFTWIEDHWFLKRSLISKLSSILKFSAIALLLLSVLDLRGREEKINSNIPDQRTIILIDKSLSMLVEDVRPNRFKKAIMMARHFVKRAAGHQVSIIVFSDTHKRVVPFTDDIDLLDSVLGGLNDLNIAKGGSELSVAIKESINYFSLNSDYKGGNLLVFTDGEEHNSLEGMTIPEEVNLAIVGVGTLKGGPIPLRRSDGSFSGYKKHNRKQVVSSLNETNIKNFVDKTRNSKYWVSLSYSLPTEEIMNFFRGRFKSKMASGEVRVRPVLVSRIVVPAIILLTISYLFSLGRTYKALSVVFLLFISPQLVKAQEEENKPKTELELQTEDMVEKMREGQLDDSQKLKLAENYLRLNKGKKAEILFEEVVKNPSRFDNDTLLNMSTAYLKNKKFSKAVPLMDELKSRSSLTDDQKKILYNNSLKSLRASKQKKKQSGKKEDKKDQDKKDKNKDKNEQKQDQNKSQENKGGKGQDKEQENKDKNKKDKNNENKDKKDKKKDGEKKKDKKNKDNKDGKGEKKKQKKKTVKDRENEIKKKRKMVKVPATLKQLMNDDRGLRKKYLKTTIGKGEKTDKKDW